MTLHPTNAGSLGLESAHGYLDRVIRELHGLGTQQKQPLLGVLQYLSDHIRRTRDELTALRPSTKGSNLLSSTADELGEIVDETARAANEIMSAAESIEVAAVGADPALNEKLLAATTRIYEASAFQDITGQRISKIVGALAHIEDKLTRLLDACGNLDAEGGPEDGRVGDAALLNGPQLAVTANSQSDIDALFDSLG